MDTVALDPRSLYSQLGSPRAPLVLDVRREAAYDKDDRLVAGATRPSGDLAAFANRHADGRGVVCYCVHGHEVSQEAARTLSQAGHQAWFLDGGIEQWRALGLPTIRRKPDWRVPGGSRWITRERPKIDRVACPWLIRRFIDPLAQFDYVPTPKVFDEARARNAVAFDLPNAPITHRAERCSFDALLEDFELHDAALDRLALIVRGADTDRPGLAPECPGLLAASLGLSARFARDHEMLEHAMSLYDGLHAWCRAQAEGREERHGWEPASA